MQVLILDGNAVIVGKMLFCDTDRETLRQGIKAQFHTEWVWFEDEICTIHDPIRGPNPQVGPRADALRN
jgi:hypothetical protein